MPNTANDRPLFAAIMILCASALFACTTLIAKFLGTGEAALHPFQVSAGRFVFAFMVMVLVSVVVKPRLARPNIGVHLLRTICGWLGVSLLFTAAARVALSDATAISFLNPVFGMMFAALILREKVGPMRWVAAIFAMIGAVVLLRPSAGGFLCFGGSSVFGL